MRVSPLLMAAILATPFLGGAQTTLAYKAKENWQDVCQRAGAQPLASIEPAGPLTNTQLPRCDETALYYGLGGKPDYAAALQCGWFQRAHPQHLIGNMFYGPGVLTMLYANGRGVRQNYDLAIRFACENDWASEAESAYRIGHLEYLKARTPPSATFDLCDDITSGLSDGSCTSIRTRARDATRAQEIGLLVSKLPLSAKQAFAPLEAAETAFEKARVQGEVDLSGTSRAAFQLQEEAKLRDQFLINLQRFGRGDVPIASVADLSSLDRMLNDVYQRIQHSSAEKWESGTIKPEGIRETERKWVSLIDAWVTFGHAAYPKLSAVRIRAQVIRLRLHQLRSLEAN